MSGTTTTWSTMSLQWRETYRTYALVLVYASLAVLLAIPALSATVPLGADMLNHLARLQVLGHIGTDPNLAHLFRIRGEIIPYLGMDILLMPLAHVMPVMVVGRLYMIALVWGLVGSIIVLQYAFTARAGFGPAVGGLIAYNGLMAWGLINYVLGLILVLLVFALWHSQRSRPWPVRLALFMAAATVIYLTHLLAFVLYGILIGSYEVFGRPRPWRTPFHDWLVLAGQAVPALLLWHMLDLPSPAFAPYYGSPLIKVLTLQSPFLFRGATGGFDSGMLAFLFGSVGLIIALGRGWLTCPRALAAPALVMLVLAVVLPWRAFSVVLIDYRFPVVVACLALAGIQLTPSARPLVVPIAAAVALLTVAHIADVSVLMHGCDSQYAELRSALAMLPRGAELTTVEERTDPSPGAVCTRLPIYEHIAQLVAIDRSGYAPDFFARGTSVATRDDRAGDSDPVSAATVTTAPAAGYLLWIHLGHRRPVPPSLVLLWHGSFFDLWAVR